MKKLIVSLSLMTSFLGISQNNLVPNGSFEQKSQCPNGFGQVNFANGWQKSLTNNNGPNNDHTDYFNSCAPVSTGFSTPSNAWGSEPACDGVAYVGMTTMYQPYGADYRENIYIQLSSYLTPGTPYYVGFCVSLADLFQNATNNIGVKFSTVPNFPINNMAHINSNLVVSNQNGWVTVQGIFVPDSAYSYLAIGNFFTDANTTEITVCQNCAHRANLYYIDNVRVTKICGWVNDSLGTDDPIDKSEHYNSNTEDARIGNLNHSESTSIQFLVFPSPVEDKLSIGYYIPQSFFGEYTYELINNEGTIMKSGNINTKSSKTIELDVTNLKSGFYSCNLKLNGLVVQSQKVIKG